MTKTFRVIGSPVAKPRLTKSSHWGKKDENGNFQYYNKSVGYYFDWAALCRRSATGDSTKYITEHSYHHMDAVFIFPIPDKFTQKKHSDALGAPLKTRPDIDNLVKGVMDAILEKDSMISSIRARKRYCRAGEEPGAIIRLSDDQYCDVDFGVDS